MFRDSRGVVHTVCSARPLDDLPPGAVDALTSALLTDAREPVDLGSTLERCDAAVELLERWQDAFFASLPEQVDADQEAQAAAAAGVSLAELEAELLDDLGPGPLDPGELVDADLGELASLDPELEALVELAEADDDPLLDPRRLLPESLVSILERELLLLPVRTRLEALVAAVDLVGDWTALLSDHEKLLGHLLLRHGDTPGGRRGHEDLVARHARLHEGRGPEHSGPADGGGSPAEGAPGRC